MKKIISIWTMLFFLGIASGQENQPTKAETMQWIASKFEKYLVSPRIYIGYTDGKFIYKRPILDDNDNPTGRYTTTVINLNQITKYSHFFNLSSYFIIEGQHLVTHPTNSEEDTEICITGTFDNDDYVSFTNIGLDETLIGRMKKALDVLIRFNSNVGKETF
jgi:hypothetical protein